jgi:hypothetical protein
VDDARQGGERGSRRFDARRDDPRLAALARMGGACPNTRDTWTVPLARIEDKWGRLPVELWNDPRMVGKVVAWRDSLAATPRAADIGVTVLSRLLEWGRLRARVRVNVAPGIPQLYRGADRAEIIWTARTSTPSAARR